MKKLIFLLPLFLLACGPASLYKVTCIINGKEIIFSNLKLNDFWMDKSSTIIYSSKGRYEYSNVYACKAEPE